MDDWFTIENIDKDTYVISEYKHWEETHCYLLCGTRQAVLIDSGLGIADIRKVIDHLTSLPITVLTTHAHWDHIGGHKYFENIAIHEQDAAWLSEAFPMPLSVVKDNVMRNPGLLPAAFSIEEYQVFQGHPQIVLNDEDCIDLGNRIISVTHTPGHSPGHCCFYEQARNYLFSGDLIYKGCLDVFYPSTDPLLFFHSIRRVKEMAITRIFPAHHTLDISVDSIIRIEQAFRTLDNQGRLKHGSGLINFDDFQIHL